jgi:hypothetical protein
MTEEQLAEALKGRLVTASEAIGRAKQEVAQVGYYAGKTLDEPTRDMVANAVNDLRLAIAALEPLGRR